MADIAMLVAEEYERGLKKSRKIGAEKSEENEELFSSVAPRANGSSYMIINKNFGEQKMGQLLKLKWWVMEEPKTQIALAAINGFFSA